MDQEGSSGYGNQKRPLWQWVLIYVSLGVVVYGLIYYFVLAKKGSYNPPPTTTPTTSSETSPSATPTSQNGATLTGVTLTADGFSPATLTIKTGTTVMWSNKSGTNATVNSDPHPAHTDYSLLNLGSLPDGKIVSLIFNKPGTYKYHNHLNPSQRGTIIVQ